MKTVLFAAAAVLAISAGTAFAAEGAGDPFPFRAPGVTTITTGRAILPPAATDPYPFRADGTIITTAMSSQMVPGNGAEGGMETLNSLPAGFSNGTVAYVQNQRIQHYMTAQGVAPATQQVAHNPAPVAPRG